MDLHHSKRGGIPMNRKKLKLQALIVCICIAAFITNVQATQDINTQPAQENVVQTEIITQTEADTAIVPDSYNTGCKGELNVVEMDTENGTDVNGVLFVAGSEGTRHVLDFAYRNKDISGTVYIENYDFSNFSLWSYNEGKVEREIHLVFNNCRFSGVSTGKAEGNITFEFNQCTFNSFNGSNSTFNDCQFGKSYTDGIVPFRNVQVNHCFFADMGSMMSEKEVHTDGTQIYGYADIDVSNVNFNNCRFEIPALGVEDSKAYVNACIMLQLEFSNAKDVSFTNCIVNGGGYSIYASSKGGDYTFENVSFQGIQFGCAQKYGVVYPKVNASVAFNDVTATDSLYIGYVWKENGETHLSVTNDTNQERTLLVYTSQGEYTYTIPACPKGSEFTTSMVYGDMPFDMDVAIAEDCQYVVCYDATISGYGKQIRFMNWSGQDVYMDEATIACLTAGGDDILLEGSCGTNVRFTLSKAGVLTLSGTGSTENYHSAKSPAWADYVEYIKAIRVEEGIEGIGTMIFRNCTSVQTVSLPDTLNTIGSRAFAGCVSLTEFTLPANIKVIGTAAFSGTILQTIYYEGEDWSLVEVGSDNELLANLGTSEEASTEANAGTSEESSTEENAGTSEEVSTQANAGTSEEASTQANAGTSEEASTGANAGTSEEASTQTNVGTNEEASTEENVETSEEASTQANAGTSEEASTEANAGTSEEASTEANAGTSEEVSTQANVGTNTENSTENSTEAIPTESAKLPEASSSKPAKVKGLKLKKKSKTSIKLSWKRVQSASGYQIAIKTGRKGRYKIIKTIKQNKTVTYTKKKLKAGKKYYVKIRAYKAINGKKVCGSYSVVKKLDLR